MLFSISIENHVWSLDVSQGGAGSISDGVV